MSSISTITDRTNLEMMNQPSVTTIFTPPPDCSMRWIYNSSVGLNFVSNFIRPEKIPLPGVASNYFEECVPNMAASARYSPGVCPSGMDIDKIKFYESSQVWGARCCSSGWTSDTIFCATTFSTPWTALVAYTESGSTYWDATVKGVTKRNFTTVSSGVAFGTQIHIMWNANDLNSFPPAYASSLAKRIGIPYPTTTPTTTPSPGSTSEIPRPTQSGGEEPPPTSSESQLSTSAKTGIGVGSAIGAIAIMIALIAVLLWRKRQRQHGKIHSSEMDGAALAQLSGDNSTLNMVEADPNAAVIPEVSGASRGLTMFLKGKWRAEADGGQPQLQGIDLRRYRAEPGTPSELE
ncbi:hypothetical protein DM02DRAFT_674992 [Periconia macrospinosa]|uniref:Uncharacterized protein n=1 Tax=Periconia macrospinosa TaxID=97972 RepID=A0A2V1DG43_9PLEO|nr:hypothetical protein DM02DRAFT_674992 [Periconia macrospinosa]